MFLEILIEDNLFIKIITKNFKNLLINSKD